MREPLQNIAFELAEAWLDNISENELIQNIPVFSSIVNILKVSKSISDRLFAAKVSSFLGEASKVTAGQRRKFLETLANDKEKQEKAGEVIAFSVEKAGDLEKASMIGTLTAKLIAEELSFEDYRRMLHAIDVTFLDDLRNFISCKYGQEAGGSLQGLSSLGLSEQEVRSFGQIKANAPLIFTYSKTKLGIEFSAILADYGENANKQF